MNGNENNPSFEELVDGYLDRRRRGDAPPVEEFVAAHPECAARLRDILPLMLDMERAGRPPQAMSHEPPATGRPPPATLGGDFRLLRELGHGGLGVVYEAEQISLNRHVAVKLLADNLAPEPKQRTLFTQESRLIAGLRHPNIVKVYSAGNDGTRWFYAMELIDGQGLDHYRSSGPREAAELVLQAARALAYAHRCHVLHRDIKPSNLLLDSEHVVHVSDFGLACVLQGVRAMFENGKARSGTWRYMAPERIAHGLNTFLGDQYSLGATLYELVAGHPVLAEKTPAELRARICAGPLPPLACPEPDLAAIVNKSTAFNPVDRYRDMDVFAEDLRRFLNREPVAARPASIPRRLVLWSRRKPAQAALSAAAAVCAAAAVIALVIGYVRTAAALRLAEQNAAVADAALTRVYAQVAAQPPSRTGSLLLEALLPYYREIASQRGLSADRLSAVDSVIGACALRAGNYPLAETSYRRLAGPGGAAALNKLAEALRHQGKRTEAAELSRAVVDRFAGARAAADRYEAVRALRALASGPDSPEFARAFALLGTLLQEEPRNSEYRFQYAVMLGKNPLLIRAASIPGVPADARVILDELADAHLDRPDYGLALLDLMERRLRRLRQFTDEDWKDLYDAFELSFRLLGRWPNDPDVVTAVSAFHNKYADTLRRSGDHAEARWESERLVGVLEILFHNPDAPDAVKETLIECQFQNLEQALREGRTVESGRLFAALDRELARYQGSLSVMFAARLGELREHPPALLREPKNRALPAAVPPAIRSRTIK